MNDDPRDGVGYKRPPSHTRFGRAAAATPAAGPATAEFSGRAPGGAGRESMPAEDQKRAGSPRSDLRNGVGELASAQGELLRPDAFDPDVIEELRVDSSVRTSICSTNRIATLQALPAFSADDFPTIAELMPPSAPVVLSVDAGMTKGNKSAFSVVQAWRLSRRSLLSVRFISRTMRVFRTCAVRSDRFRKRYRPAAILIERAANGNALISDLAASTATS